MAIFLTGGNGKVTSRIAERLKGKATILRSSRTPSDEATVRFEWSDRSTHGSPFKGEEKITSVFIVLPGRSDCDEDVFSFIRTGLENGVQCFTLLSATICEPGADAPSPHGRIHHFLRGIQAENNQIQISVLRPAFFMENFSEQQHLPTIREDNTIYSATGTGTEAFVSCEDIASIGTRCLLGEGDTEEYLIVGPQAVSYDEIAQILSRATGLSITHTKLSVEDFEAALQARGLPKSYAQLLGQADKRIAEGYGEKSNCVVPDFLGRQPVTFQEFAEHNKHVWI